MNVQTGWERNKRTIFDNIVESYDFIRPEYPPEIFDDIFKYTETSDTKRAIEIGAGTGRATDSFIKAGYDVTAIELGANMASFLSDKFKNDDNFKVVTSSFEDAILEENYYDLIYAATSFHWVDAKTGCPKAFRLLKNGGAFALFRYNAIAAYGDSVFDEIQSFYEKYYYSFNTSSERPVKKSKEDFLKPSEIYKSFRFEDLKNYGFKDVSMKFYDGSKTFNADEYIVLLDTMADHISLPDSNKQALYHGIRETIFQHGNCYKVDYIFQLYMGRK